MARHAENMNFEQVLAPVGAAQFFSEYWTKRPTQHGVRRPRPRIRLPQGLVEQNAPLTPRSAIRLANHSALVIEREAGEPLAKFFAAGTYWYIRPEFVAAFQRLSGSQSVELRELAATIADRNLVPMLHGAIDALAGAGFLFKENS